MSEPGITQTDILKLNKPDKGYFDWDVPLNENWDKLDVLGAGQLPLLSLLEVRYKLSGADLIGWSLQGSELDGDVYTSVWDLVYAAKQRASTQKSKQIRGVTYYYVQDEVTGMVFVDSENYNKGLSNLGDSLGYICTYIDGVKYIKLPEDRSFNGAILSGDGVPGEFEDESLPDHWHVQGWSYPISSQQNTKYGAADGKAVSTYYDTGNSYSSSEGAKTSPASLYFGDTYKEGAVVKPRTHKTYRYYKVGNTVVNSGQIDMGNVLSTLASKAGTDLLNVTNAGKAQSISWGMPDYSRGYTIPTTNGYTGILEEDTQINITNSVNVYSDISFIVLDNEGVELSILRANSHKSGLYEAPSAVAVIANFAKGTKFRIDSIINSGDTTIPKILAFPLKGAY